MIPYGAVGKLFVEELAEQLSVFVDSAGENCTAMHNFFVLPALMLQTTRKGCKVKKNNDIL